MKTIIKALDYPALQIIPQYIDEAHKLARFTTALHDAEREADRIAATWLKSLESLANQSEADRIAEAESLLSGKPLQGYAEQIECNRMLIASLRRAVKAQETAVNRIVAELSTKAAQRFEAEHKVRTQRVIDAVTELAAANASEIALRESIDALGYRQKLPCTRFEVPNCPIDPQDPAGGYVVAWFADMTEYLQTAEQWQDKATTDGRRRKLAALSAS